MEKVHFTLNQYKAFAHELQHAQIDAATFIKGYKKRLSEVRQHKIMSKEDAIRQRFSVISEFAEQYGLKPDDIMKLINSFNGFDGKSNDDINQSTLEKQDE